MVLKFKKSKDISPVVPILMIYPPLIFCMIVGGLRFLGVSLDEALFDRIMVLYSIVFFLPFIVLLIVPRVSIINLDNGDINTSYFGIRHKLNIRDIQEIRKEPIYYHCATFGYQYKYIFIKDRLKIEVGDIFGYYDQFDLLAEKVPQWINEYNIKYEEVE